MRAITVNDRAAGAGGLSLTDMPYPHAAENDVVVRVYAAGSRLESSTGRPPGPTAPAGTGRRAYPGMSSRASSPNWDTEPRA
jgi:hypothetical protein